MADNSNSTVYIGNLDERVSDRVLYDILIQAGRLVDLYIPRDKDTDKPKGYAFAQYESEEIAQYAVNLFSGLVTLYRRTLKFAISGQDKSSLRPDKSSLSLPISSTPTGSSSLRSRAYNAPYNSMELSSPSPRFSEHKLSYAQVPSDNLCNNQMGIDHIMTTPIPITVEEYLGHWIVLVAVGRDDMRRVIQ
ncbi:UNVERIFIED_CONTAM: Splicing factor 3B subunit [Sesamum latifolium]|uniref:Splicing factor 3B subunit n=1 Tax=Sesamum latifolium TaxID=2727402 RepID=A0AAW2XRA9_9LAMI